MRLFKITAAHLYPKSFAGASILNQLQRMKVQLRNEKDRVEVDLKSEMV